MNCAKPNPNTVILISGCAIALVATAVLSTANQVDNWKYVGFWSFLFTGLYSSGLIFRDMSDFNQFVIKMGRSTTLWTWFKRKKILSISIFCMVPALCIQFSFLDVAGNIVVAVFTIIWVAFIFSGYFYPHIMMRTRQDSGRIVSVSEAKNHIKPNESVIVVEVNGHARAHSDRQVLRPTYCGLTNLGIAVSPKTNGVRLNLRPMTQLNNNLVVVDEDRNIAIQQLWMKPTSTSDATRKLKEWPSFRMPFNRFESAYPEGEVFFNEYRTADTRVKFSSNPLLATYDRLIEAMFEGSVDRQKVQEKPEFPTLEYGNKRLPPKALIWASNIENDYVIYTEGFVKSQGGALSIRVGNRGIIVAYDKEFESLGVFYNDSGHIIESINFYG